MEMGSKVEVSKAKSDVGKRMSDANCSQIAIMTARNNNKMYAQ